MDDISKYISRGNQNRYQWVIYQDIYLWVIHQDISHQADVIYLDTLYQHMLCNSYIKRKFRDLSPLI